MREGKDIGGLDFEEEDNYFISLADLMTGVVFIFVILLVIYAMTLHATKRDLETARTKVDQLASAEARAREFQEKTDALGRELKEKQSRVEQIDALALTLKEREKQRETILRSLLSRLEKRGVRLSLDPENGIVRLPEELLFDSGQAVLRPEGAQALQILAAELSESLQSWCSSDQEFRLEALFIEGHTDNVPIKNARFADNWELSTSRAVNIARAFKQSQPQLAQFKNPKGLPVLGVSGYGENRPVTANSSEEGRRNNRRIDLRFLVAYPTDEQISKLTHGLISPDATTTLTPQKDTKTNP